MGVTGDVTVRPSVNIHYVSIELSDAAITLTGDATESSNADLMIMSIYNGGDLKQTVFFKGDFFECDIIVEPKSHAALLFISNRGKFVPLDSTKKDIS